MSDVSHGVNASKTSNGAITPVSVDTGVHFVVGTAPVQMVNGKVNEVIMASSYKEAVQALGYSDDWKKYSLCEEIYTAFTLFNSAQVFFVNVLDPKKHKKTVDETQMDVVDGQIVLPAEAIAGSVEITGKTAGEDYEVFYSDTNCVVEFLKETTGKLTVKYDAVDASQVTKSDIIGGYSVSTHKTTGLELINNVFPLYTKVPDLILCPNWSHDAEVAAVMSAKAENITDCLRVKQFWTLTAQQKPGRHTTRKCQHGRNRKTSQKEQKLSASLKLRWEIEFSIFQHSSQPVCQP